MRQLRRAIGNLSVWFPRSLWRFQGQHCYFSAKPEEESGCLERALCPVKRGVNIEKAHTMKLVSGLPDALAAEQRAIVGEL